MASKKKKEDDFSEVAGMVGKGFLALIRSPTKLIIFLIVCYLCIWVTQNQPMIATKMGIDGKLQAILIYGVWVIPVFMLMVFSAKAPLTMEERFRKIGFQNKDGETPQLMGKKKEKSDNGMVVEYEFSSEGIPLYEWKNRRVILENILDCNIVSIRQNNESKQSVFVKTMDAKLSIPTRIDWDDEYTPEKDFELSAGQGLLGKVKFDFNSFPHALVAGQTGSGKSVILRCMLWQAIKKGAKVYIIDFKGGVEFDRRWEDFATVVMEKEDAIALVKHLCTEMRMRLALFRAENCKNIVDYNKKHPEDPICRIILGCDEVAEMLDSEGLDKEEKALIKELEQGLGSLARLSRAAGINMIMGMQRPDAKVLKGQIKNNLPIRISGRFADIHASQIVLGNDMAAYLDETRGRFLYSTGADTYEFQAFLFEDYMLKDGDWQVGKTLNKAPIGSEENTLITDDDDFREFETPEEEKAKWEIKEEPIVLEDDLSGYTL